MNHKLVYKSDLYSEDFLLHKERDDLYYAFITEGTHDHQQIKRLKGSSHYGPFVHDGVIFEGSARIGSLVKYHDHYRLYFNEIDLVNRNIRNTSYLTAKTVGGFSPGVVYRTNVKCIDNFYCQPFCLYENEEFVLFVNKVTRNGACNQVNVYHSKDGDYFYQKFPNPLIHPSEHKNYSTKIGNPCVFYDDGIFVIIAECNKGGVGWRLCKFYWDGKDAITYHHNAIMGEELIRANPFLYKHENIYILYFGVFNGRCYEVHAVEYGSIDAIV